MVTIFTILNNAKQFRMCEEKKILLFVPKSELFNIYIFFKIWNVKLFNRNIEILYNEPMYMDINLQFTLRCKGSDTVSPWSLKATHWYRPRWVRWTFCMTSDWLVMMIVLRVASNAFTSPVNEPCNGRPSWSQTTSFTDGFARTLHSRYTSLPSRIESRPILAPNDILSWGATVMKTNRRIYF